MKREQFHIVKARIIRDTLGVKAAAGYLRNRCWSVESAVQILCRGV